jgi:hypothetical protein
MSDTPHTHHHKHHPQQPHHFSDAHCSPVHHDGSAHGAETHHIIHHIKDDDYKHESEARHAREVASVSASSSASRPLHHLDITDLEKDKRTLLNTHASTRERLSAAQALEVNHQNKVSFVDGKGIQHDLQISRSRTDGRLRVFEGDNIILEDLNNKSYTDHLRPLRHIQGLHYSGRDSSGYGTYHQPSGGRRIYSPHVDPRYYNLTQNPDGSRTVDFNGCEVDTDGASYHPEDACWQSHTSLRLANGESLNTDLDNFVVLSPSLARAMGVKLGDRGYLVDKDTGRAVPVVFGDVGPEGKRTAEASVHALKEAGHPEVNGNNGVGGHWQVVVLPGSGDGTGNIARNADAIKLSLDAATTKPTPTV